MTRRPRVKQGDTEDAFAVVRNRYRGAVEAALRSIFSRRSGVPYTLMRYHLGWTDAHGRVTRSPGGKMLRPVLCLLACEAAGGDWRRAVPAAAAVELLHNFTLIHDDVEDGSERRHRRPTLWRICGKELAINAGDGMFALAHVALLRLSLSGVEPERVVRAVRLLDETTLTLCEGQHLDLAQDRDRPLTKAAYLRMIEGKTSALLSTSAAIGALVGGGGGGTIDALSEYGRQLGFAFQIRDDILGIWGSEATTGKSSEDDLRSGKQTYPIVAARAKAKPGERKAFDALVRRAKRDRTAAKDARAVIERLGAREAARRAAQRFAAAAIESLPKRGLAPARVRELEALARFAADRES